MKVVYDWLKDYVGEKMPDVETFDRLFTFHAFEIDGIETVGEKTVVDVKVLPDRAGDCLSHLGIARELGTLLGIELEHDVCATPAELTPLTDKVTVSIHDTKNCTRFGTAVITGVKVAPSPAWLRDRLEALGQRSINNVVDATNYVMLSLGQPLHAYDGAKFESKDGVWHFGVRMAREGEKVTILGGEVKEVTPLVQVITNGQTDTPVGIAGIKGGESAGIDENTTTIILEAAHFNPEVTRKAGQAVRLQTDALKRFENNISPELVPYALTSCVQLILEMTGGTLIGYTDTYEAVEVKNSVRFTRRETHALLGVSLSDTEIEDILTRLHFMWERNDEGWSVTPPFYRRDILIPEDIIADIGRVYGYEHVTSVLPTPMPVTEVNARHYYGEKIRSVLVEHGFSEVITSSFRNKDEIALANALASDKGCLRSSLRENIKEVLERNTPFKDLLNVSAVRVFEIGTVFYKADGDVKEYTSLAIGVRTKQQPSPKDTEAIDEARKEIEKVLGKVLEGTDRDGIFEVNLSELLEKLSVPTSYDTFTPNLDTTFVPYSLYPFIVRDIALWVPEAVSHEDIETMITDEGGVLLTKLTLFDEFKKEGRTSYAFRLIFQSMERTLTDEEVNVVMEGLYELMKSKGFEVR